MISEKKYRNTVMRHTPKRPYLKNAVWAFFVGGGICLFGELLANLFTLFTSSEKNSYLLVTVTLILLSVTLTSLGIYDKIARLAGAGTLVPVTGFANAVASSALDTRAEGYISGVGCKIFTVAGPVILYSALGGAVWGVIYYLSKII